MTQLSPAQVVTEPEGTPPAQLPPAQNRLTGKRWWREIGWRHVVGVIALFGMIIRNSVILVDQIEHDIASGTEAWDAIVEAAVRRCRPILLTAAAAALAMIPLSRSVFWGPMAVAIMGGLIVATLNDPAQVERSKFFCRAVRPLVCPHARASCNRAAPGRLLRSAPRGLSGSRSPRTAPSSPIGTSGESLL